MCRAQLCSMEILVLHVVRLSAVIALGLSASVVALPVAAASVTQEAKKVCTERYNAEKDGGTLPVGMPKSKYMSQCTKGYVRTAQLSQQGETPSGQSEAQGSNLNSKPVEPVKAQPAPYGH